MWVTAWQIHAVQVCVSLCLTKTRCVSVLGAFVLNLSPTCGRYETQIVKCSRWDRPDTGIYIQAIPQTARSTIISALQMKACEAITSITFSPKGLIRLHLKGLVFSHHVLKHKCLYMLCCTCW